MCIIFVQFISRNRPRRLSITALSVHNVFIIVQYVIDEDARQRRMRTWMRLPMADQTRLLSEGFAADIAHVRSDAGVNE